MHLKRILLLFIILPQFSLAQNPMELWYSRPADVWEEAIPLGNGKLAAMVFGKTDQERYQLNDNTLWTDQSRDQTNPEAAKLLPILCQQIFDKDYASAEETWRKMQGPYSSSYLPMADLWLDFVDSTKIENYRRLLDLETATTRIEYKINETKFTRELFVSHKDGVMAIRMKSSANQALNFKISLNSTLKYEIKKGENQSIILHGQAPWYVASRPYYENQILYDDDKGIRFQVKAQIKNKDGQLHFENNQWTVKNASEIIYLAGATSFNGFDKDPATDGKEPAHEIDRIFEGIQNKSYEQIKQRHIEDYQSLFKRVNLYLAGNPEAEKMDTDTRLKQFNSDPTDLGLISLYYQFGRYLMISGSRAGGRPMNLQGIWNEHVQPPWRSNYTININTEMNYWPTELTNLSECHEPLLAFIEELSQTGFRTAKENYGIKNGWLAHHNSDLWAISTPVGDFTNDRTYYPGAFAWQKGGAWLSLHLWERYLFTQDKIFLKEKAYPLMKGAAQFLMHWLIEDPETGYLVTAPSTSPENAFKFEGKNCYISKGSGMDMQISKELLLAVKNATKVLNTDRKFRTKLTQTLDKLYPIQIGRYGQIQEWFEDLDDPKDTHRHISQLFGLHPGTQIDPMKTPRLAEAAKTTLEHRSDAGTGWSMAWKVNWWARLGDGNRAMKILTQAFNYINPADKSIQMSGGGTYPNLLDAHPPFQIDGNFGATAGFTEMLIQSHSGTIQLLPALPDVWEKGSVKGLKARGNFEIDMKWNNGKLEICQIKSLSGGKCRLSYNGNLIYKGKERGKNLTLSIKKGKTYTIKGVN